MSTNTPTPETDANQQTWDRANEGGCSADFARNLECQRDEALKTIDEIGNYLWPNQTGLPNKHRDALLAIKTRDRLMAENSAGLAKERNILQSHLAANYHMAAGRTG